MNYKSIKHELQHILQGESQDSQSTLIQSIAGYLRKSQETSPMAQGDKHDKTQETKRLVQYINKHHLWNCDIEFNAFVSSGAGQRVYMRNDFKVLKLNDGIYYQSWVDYFNNLLLNNYFFPDTAYQLVGFYKSDNGVVYALVEQNYVDATEPTDLNLVKQFLENNGFLNTKNHDYYNPDLGIILEDLHDENVLTKQGVLYFIDTVFYIKPEILWSRI